MNNSNGTFVASERGHRTALQVHWVQVCLTLFLSFVGIQAFAVTPTSGITYTGRILDTNDQPITASQVVFTVTITDPSRTCMLYQEQRVIDMSDAAGNYAFEVGSSDTTLIAGSVRWNGTLSSIADIFDNTKSYGTLLSRTGYPCSGGYDPTTASDPNEGRAMNITFSVDGGNAQALPPLRLTPVPTAMQAFNAAKIGGYGTGDMIRIDPTVTKTTHPNTDLTQTQYDEFWNLILGTSTTYLKAIPTLGGDVTGTLPAMKVIKIQNYDVDSPAAATSGNVLTYNGTKMVWQAVSTSGGITSLNGLTSATQSFASGTSALTISSSGSTHTLSIANASSSGTGLLSSTDWTAFNSKLSSTLGTGQVWVGNASGGAEPQTLSGDVASVSATGSVTLKKTQSAQGSYLLQLDSSGNAYVNGVDIKGSSAVTSLRYTGSTNLTLNLPTTSGSVNQFLQTDGAGNLSWASQSAMLPSISAGQVWVGNASNGAQAFTLSGDVASVSSTGLVTLTSSASGSNKLPLAGGTMSGAIAMGANDITNAGNIVMANNKYFTLSSNTTDGSTTGQIWFDGANIKYFDGTTAKTLGVAGAGITSFNGASTSTQTLAVPGTSGTAPNWVTDTSGGVHYLNIPMASSASVTAGLISNSDYAAMKSAQSSSLGSAQVWVGNASGAAQARTLSGDVTIDNVGSVTVDKTQLGVSSKILQLDSSGVANSYGVGIKGATSGTVNLLAGTTTSNYSLSFPSVAPSDNQILQVDHLGQFTWVSNAANVTNAASLASGQMWVGNASGIAAAVSMTGDATIDNAGVLTLKSTGTAGTYSKVITDAQGRVTSGSALASGDVVTALGFTPVNRAGDSMTGDLITQNLNIVAGKYLGLGATTTAGTTAGQMWLDGANIKYFDGTSARTLGVAGAGITSFNGSSANSQSLAIPGTSGTAPNWVTDTSGGVHYLNIPMAATSSVTAGLLSKTDYDSFSGKQSNSLASASVWVGNSAGGAQARALSGDITVDNTGLVTLKSTGTIGTYWKVVTDAQGRVTSGAALASGDVTTALGYTPANASTGYVNGGNSFAGNATIGLNDAYTLGFKTNNLTQMTITSDGKVGIGTTNPVSKFQIGQATTVNTDYGSTLFITGNGGCPNCAGSPRFMLEDHNVGTTTVAGIGFGGDVLGFGSLNTAGSVWNNSAILGINTSTYTSTFSGLLITQSVSMTANNYLTLSANSSAGNKAGQMWYDSGVIKYFDGTSARTLGVSGSGITSLNGLTSGTQSFVIDTNGTSPQMVSSGSAHTLSIPMASTSAATAGLISNADYVAMKSAQSSSLASAQVWVGNASGAAQARALSGDATISNVGLVTVDKTQSGASSKILQLDSSGVANAYGVGVKGATSGTVNLLAGGTTANYSLTFPSTAPADNQILQVDHLGNFTWVSNTASVTNAASLASGTMWIGNASGVAAAVTMSGDATIANTGLLTLKSTGTAGTYWKVVTDAQGRVTSGAALASGDVTTALGYVPANASTGYVNGGNSFAGNATIGLNDAHTLGFKTNNATQMTLTAAGKLGIGTTAPISNLHVHSTANADNDITASVTGSGTLERAGVNLVTLSDGNALGSTSNNRGWSMTAYGNGYGTGDSNSLDFGFWGGSTWKSVLRLDEDGTIGIGTTSPSYSLDISGKTDAVRLPNGTDAQRPTAAKGLIRFNTTSNVVEYHNGSAWVTVGTSSGSLSSSLASNNIYIGNSSGGAEAHALSGDMTITNSGLATVDKTQAATASKILQLSATGTAYTKGVDINGGGSGSLQLRYPSSSNTIVMNFPTSSGSANQYLQTDGNGNLSWSTVSAGTTLPSISSGQMWVGNASNGAQAFTLSGDVSSVSSTGAVTVVKSTTGTANQIVALDGSSIGTMNGLKLVTGAYNVTLTAATTGTASYTLRLPAGTPAANQTLQSDASGNLSWVAAGGTGYVNGGNSFGANASIGLTDSYNLDIKTNNVARMTVLSNGNITMGNGSTGTTSNLTITKSSAPTSVTTANEYLHIGGQEQNSNSYRVMGFGYKSSEVYPAAYMGFQETSTSGSSKGDLVFGARNVTSDSAPSEIVRITSAGQVGVGTAAPADTLQVAGTIRGASYDNSSSTTIDWSKGNSQYTAAGCTGTQYTFSNMRDGGVYTLAITGTFSASCTFGQTSPDTLSGTAGSGAFYFLPSNTTPSGSNAVYSFMRVGSKVYVTWNSGFQN